MKKRHSTVFEIYYLYLILIKRKIKGAIILLPNIRSLLQQLTMMVLKTFSEDHGRPHLLPFVWYLTFEILVTCYKHCTSGHIAMITWQWWMSKMANICSSGQHRPGSPVLYGYQTGKTCVHFVCSWAGCLRWVCASFVMVVVNVVISPYDSSSSKFLVLYFVYNIQSKHLFPHHIQYVWWKYGWDWIRF